VCDYGQVLCIAPPPPDWAALVDAAAHAGWRPPPASEAGAAAGADEAFTSVYWAERVAYDRADLSVAEYWEKTIGSPPAKNHLDALVDADRAMWLHPNPDSVDAAQRAAGRGLRLALFSNAPVEVAAGIDRLAWLDGFGPRFFSCYLRSVKPEPAAYRAVLEGLGARPADLVFFDDRPANVEGAARMGIDARLFTDPAQIDEV